MRKYVRQAYKRLVPKPIRRKLAEYAKGVIAASGGILIIVNSTAPEYSDDVQTAINVLVAFLTFVGVVGKRNRPQAG